MPNSWDPRYLIQVAFGVARTRIRDVRVDATIAAGAAFGRVGRQLLLRPWRKESVRIPDPITLAGAASDIVNDLSVYSGLPEERVIELLRRQHTSFRAEWHLTPEPLRTDAWFYLSSSTYLFANAVHDPRPLVERLSEHTAERGRSLEFGGGTGNLAIELLLAGWEVDYLERSALQKDFVTFRIDQRDLRGLRVLNTWRPLERGVYRLVTAVDVLEHVPDLEQFLRERLLPAIGSGGLLAEASAFVRNISNPMHHEHRTLDDTLAAGGLELEGDYPEGRVWRKK
jgi:hypothetical protein